MLAKSQQYNPSTKDSETNESNWVECVSGALMSMRINEWWIMRLEMIAHQS